MESDFVRVCKKPQSSGPSVFAFFFFLNIYAHMDKQFHINLNHQIVFGLEHVCSLYVMGSLLARLKVLKC